MDGEGPHLKEDVAVIGIDLAKSVFQVHGIDADGRDYGVAVNCPSAIPSLFPPGE